MRPTTLDPTRMGCKAQDLEAHLRSRVVGQAEAVEQIANAYQTYVSGMTSPGRPIATFLFLGPTGSGKTRVVEATAEHLLNNPGAVIKIDCAEFQHSHEIANLIGSPPGYLGHRETKPGTQPRSARPTPNRYPKDQHRPLRRNRESQRCSLESSPGHSGNAFSKT